MKRIVKIKVKYFLIFFCTILILSIVFPTFMKYYVSVTANVVGYAKETRSSTYTVRFHSNGGTGSMQDMTVTYNEAENLTSNTFVYSGYNFSGWNTEANGTGTGYSDGQEINMTDYLNGDEIDLYAQWVQGVAMIGNTVYNTLQAAINAVPTNNTETTIVLLTNVTENLTVNANKNITFNFNNHTVTNSGTNSVFKNHGTVRISNGTITQTSSNESAFDNSSTAKLYISGGTIQMTNTGGKQAIYNNGGIVEISGTAYLSAVGNQSDPNKQRPAVHNLNNGTLTITGGTIISNSHIAVKNDAGTLVIGAKDGTSNNASPVIQGGTYGVSSTPGYSFYDGIIKGKTNAVNNESLITDIEDGLSIIHQSENIGGVNYQTIILGVANVYRTVTFNPNGGSVNEPTRNVLDGDPIGTLPVPTQAGYDFDGWFTLAEGGSMISSSTIITSDITYFAHWTENYSAMIGTTYYSTLQSAINAVPTNTQTTITLCKNVSEALEVAKNKNIVFDLQNYTISNDGNKQVIVNNGTIAISNGTIESNADFATIDNNSGARLVISGGNIIATGTRGAIYNTGGTVEISGTAYLSSAAVGRPDNMNYDRATINNIKNGHLTITGGEIICTVQEAVNNDTNGTLTIGSKDGSINNTSPIIMGKRNGIINTGTFNFYDGIVKGITGTISGTIADIEANSTRTTGTETIGGDVYQTEYLVPTI